MHKRLDNQSLLWYNKSVKDKRKGIDRNENNEKKEKNKLSNKRDVFN